MVFLDPDQGKLKGVRPTVHHELVGQRKERESCIQSLVTTSLQMGVSNEGMTIGFRLHRT